MNEAYWEAEIVDHNVIMNPSLLKVNRTIISGDDESEIIPTRRKLSANGMLAI